MTELQKEQFFLYDTDPILYKIEYVFENPKDQMDYVLSQLKDKTWFINEMLSDPECDNFTTTGAKISVRDREVTSCDLSIDLYNMIARTYNCSFDDIYCPSGDELIQVYKNDKKIKEYYFQDEKNYKDIFKDYYNKIFMNK
jgi:hypothetical protein